ncbi:MAG: 1-deoxy-D-xylulose-5-phosphate synthase, partial [Xanthomonadales bacterium]|nr:1-deoxy-D-xylulose-5-phosphate synthase [Xanthomonadales bacterium]
MLSTGYRHPGPAAVRYPRGSGPGVAVSKDLDTLPIGEAEVRRRGRSLALLAFGAMVAEAAKVGLEIDATVVNMRFIKPLDEKLLLEIARSHDGLITIEDNAVQGGAGSAVAELLAAHGIAVPLLQLGLPDRFIEHMTREELLAEVGLDVAGIRASIRKRWPQQPVPVRSVAG